MKLKNGRCRQVLVALAFSATFPAYGDISVNIVPETSTISLASLAEFAVNISGLGSGTALSATDISIGFDPTLLSYRSSVLGDPA